MSLPPLKKAAEGRILQNFLVEAARPWKTPHANASCFLLRIASQEGISVEFLDFSEYSDPPLLTSVTTQPAAGDHRSADDMVRASQHS